MCYVFLCYVLIAGLHLAEGKHLKMMLLINTGFTGMSMKQINFTKTNGINFFFLCPINFIQMDDINVLHHRCLLNLRRRIRDVGDGRPAQERYMRLQKDGDTLRLASSCQCGGPAEVIICDSRLCAGS